MIRNRGTALVPVLLLAQFIALMMTYSLSAIRLNFKLNHYMLQRELNFRFAHRALQNVEAQLHVGELPCRVSLGSPYRFEEKQLSWWREMGCRQHYKEHEFFYVIEFLGNDSCAVVKNIEGEMMTANYYRLSAIWIKQKVRNARLILQSTFIQTVPSSSVCKEVIHEIMPGRQSLRELMIKTVD